MVERIKARNRVDDPVLRPNTLVAAMCGAGVAAIAIFLRLTISTATGGEHAIFSFPAVVIATLLFGVRAGAVAAMLCMAALWYFILPPVHSFTLRGPSEIISLLVYLFVACALIWAIGAMRHALVRYETLTDELEDLVDRRTAERNRVWERSQELVAIVTPAGAIDAVNPSLRSKLSVDFDAVSQTSFSSIVFEEDWPVLDAALDRLAVGSPSVVFEARLRGAEGLIWVEWSAVSDGACIYLVGRDCTAEHDCSERLAQSQKMEFVGQMTGGLVHDFANLLSPIIMALDLLRQRHASDERTSDLIASARESTVRADLLVQRLLKFARSEKAAPKLMSVRLLIEQVTGLLRQVIVGRDLEMVLGDNLREIRVDPNAFDMALLNLAVNARDATAPGGRIRLTAENVDDHLMVIAVEDDGQGMDAETLRRACDPFFSTKGPERGTGLGLSMVHNFAVNAGGSFRLESQIGRGTAARIYLSTVEIALDEKI